jgi:hypothetical protein
MTITSKIWKIISWNLAYVEVMMSHLIQACPESSRIADLKIQYLGNYLTNFDQINCINFVFHSTFTCKQRGCNQTLCYGKCWSKLLLTKQTFDLFFPQSCDIKSEFSYIICSYLRRFVIILCQTSNQSARMEENYCSSVYFLTAEVLT